MNKISLILFLVFIGFSKEPIIAEAETPLSISNPNSAENIQNPLSEIPEKMLYFEAGSFFKSLSLLTQLGRMISPIISKDSSLDAELLLFDDLCNHVSSHFFLRMFSKDPIEKYLGLSSKIPYSQSSWYVNQIQLSQIPTSSQEDKELLFFLQNRWLAKSTGFHS